MRRSDNLISSNRTAAMPKNLESLRSTDVRKIDLDEARRHFDLPIEEQFSSRRDLISGLAGTKSQFINLFKGSDVIEVWRGMDCDREWAENVQPGEDLGDSWSWQQSGALKGSGLESRVSSGVLIVGEVHESDVDWELSIAVGTFHEDECEIVIGNPSAVTVTRIIEWPSGEVLRDFAASPMQATQAPYA
jgi:hypothetical protein